MWNWYKNKYRRRQWQEMSMGELTDKLTILEIKIKKFKTHDTIPLDLESQVDYIYMHLCANVSSNLTEYEAQRYWELYEQLRKSNKEQWDLEDMVISETDSKVGFKAAQAARDCNLRRAGLKKEIDIIFREKFLEVKKYATDKQ